VKGFGGGLGEAAFGVNGAAFGIRDSAFEGEGPAFGIRDSAFVVGGAGAVGGFGCETGVGIKALGIRA
jgi:hypothetical protein